MEAHVAASPRRGSDAVPVPAGLLGDERLARQVAHGSDRAFAALYERYHQRIYRYCRSMVRDDADAQDAMQSAFAGALVALRRAQRDAPLRPWLFRIAHNESVSLLRRRRPQGELPEGLESSAPSMEEAAVSRERLAQLVADLRELPERQRGALLMRELSGLSHEEIAAALGISVAAAKQTVFEARRSLMEFSEGRAMTCEETRRTVSDGDKRVLRGRRVHAHLRHCQDCASFADAIAARSAEFKALYPPIPAIAASTVLARIMGGGSGHAGGGGGGLLSVAAGKTAGLAASVKGVAAGAALVVAGAAGTAGVLRHVTHTRHSPAVRDAPATSARGSSGAAAGATTTGTPGSVQFGTNAARQGSPGGLAGAGTATTIRLTTSSAINTAGIVTVTTGGPSTAAPASSTTVGGAVPGSGAPSSARRSTGASAAHRPSVRPGRPASPGSGRPTHAGGPKGQSTAHPSGSAGTGGPKSSGAGTTRTGAPAHPPHPPQSQAGTHGPGTSSAGGSPPSGASGSSAAGGSATSGSGGSSASGVSGGATAAGSPPSGHPDRSSN